MNYIVACLLREESPISEVNRVNNTSLLRGQFARWQRRVFRTRYMRPHSFQQTPSVSLLFVSDSCILLDRENTTHGSFFLRVEAFKKKSTPGCARSRSASSAHCVNEYHLLGGFRCTGFHHCVNFHGLKYQRSACEKDRLP